MSDTKKPALGRLMKELKLPGQTITEFKKEWDELTEQDKLDLTAWLDAEDAAA